MIAADWVGERSALPFLLPSVLSDPCGEQEPRGSPKGSPQGLAIFRDVSKQG